MKKTLVRCVAGLLAGAAMAADEPAAAESKPAAGDSPVAEADTDKALTDVRAYIAEQKIDRENPNWRVRLPKFPSLTYTEGKTYYWNLDTNKGAIKVKLLPDVAPNHVANYVYLSELGYFDGLIFHRVIPNFMAQGGCPLGRGNGGPGYEFAGEFKAEVKHDKPGLLSMANRGPGTDGSQFFLTFVATPWLDGKHTIFGETDEAGLAVLKKLEAAGSRSGATSEELKINSAKITVE